MSLKVKSNGVSKSLVENPYNITEAYKEWWSSDSHCSVTYNGIGFEIMLNTEVSFPKGTTEKIIGHLPSELSIMLRDGSSSHDIFLGVFGLISSAWVPNDKNIYVRINEAGEIIGRVDSTGLACSGVCIIRQFTTRLKYKA